MNIGDRVKFITMGGWYNSGIIKDMDKDSYLIEVDELGCKPPKDVHIQLPYYAKVLSCEMIAESEGREVSQEEDNVYREKICGDKKMTNQEAIKELEYVKKQTGYADIALDMAIKALEQKSYKSEAKRWKRRYLDLKAKEKEWLQTFNTDSATECFTAVQRLKESVK